MGGSHGMDDVEASQRAGSSDSCTSDSGEVVAIGMPQLVVRASRHGRQDMHQSRRITTSGECARYQLFLAKVTLAVFNFNPRRRTHFLRPFPDALPQRLGKSRIVKNTDIVCVQKTRHSVRVAGTKRARDDESIKTSRSKTGQHSMQIRRIAFFQCRRSHGQSPHHRSGVNRNPCLVPVRPA